MKKLLQILLGTILLTGSVFSQPMLIDKVVGIVGEYTILQSDIENQYLQYKAQGVNVPDLKCMIYRDFLEQKLMMNQAKIDSLEVSESNVEMSLDQRLDYFINQIGSVEELEAYFNKTVLEIKEDLRTVVRDQMITQKMQGVITGDIKTTPSEVRKFYNSLPTDSIPYIDAMVEIQHIMIYPALGDAAIFEVKERLLDLRKRILEGESFETLAILYSEGPSAPEGGDIGFLGKGELDAAYAKEAFSLKKGGVSKIVESDFGFHLIQLVERRDDKVRTRHILMKPRINIDARQKAISRLDSLAQLIRSDSISFEIAARYYSEDKSTAINKGLMVNPRTNSSQFELKQLDTKDYEIARDLELGEVSKPYESLDENHKTVYKIIKLKSRTDPHRANLKQDYLLLQNMALEEKKQLIIEEWILEKKNETYFKIDPLYQDCIPLKGIWID
ncbi:MAG: peptidylprolyl isomerase [Bacteroidales bacterium]|nr:peptidylprolyl isomerase [Bacteroidales bacterium]MCF8391189.1 peptidylprolyl isomerase [Bacteroidales bacterium]